MRYIFLTLACILCAMAVEAQTDNGKSDPQYISVPYPVELNLPQLDMSLTIPTRVGFAFPVMYGKNVSMDINEQTYYCWDEAFVQDGEVSNFYFAQTITEPNPLKMTVSKYTEDVEDFLQISSFDDLKDFVKEEKKLNDDSQSKSKNKTSDKNIRKGNTFVSKDEKTSAYEFYYNGYKIVFSYQLPLDAEKLDIYNSIINSIRAKNLR